jgi:hypothetical protein
MEVDSSGTQDGLAEVGMQLPFDIIPELIQLDVKGCAFFRHFRFASPG